MTYFKQILLAASLSVLSGIASAVPISGGIGFGGNLTTNTGDVTTASVFTFVNPISATGFDSFAPLTGQDITYKALDLSGALPLISFWSGTGSDMAATAFSFDLGQIATTLGKSAGSSIFDTLTLSGRGIVHVGSELSNYDWTLTTQNPAIGGNPLQFTFSASQAKAPEPALALLLSTGLIGFGVARKLRKKA